MENITHSLLGATLAELTLPPKARPAQRRLFYVAGIVAANLPDADLIYTRITPPPLGYLLHHRGHTHTLVGELALAILIWVITLIPGIRRIVAESPGRFWSLIGLALLSHIFADSWGSYGVHPFWPIDNRWFYSDSVSIIGPWFWVIFGVALAASAQSRVGRLLLAGMTIALPLALTWLGMMARGALVALAVVGAAVLLLGRGVSPARRAAGALATALLFVAVSFGFSRFARSAAVAALPAQHGEILDVVLNPNTAVPFCWNAVAIEKNEREGAYVLRRGRVSLVPGDMCDMPPEAVVVGSRPGAVIWTDARRESLTRLRDLSRNDCWVRAWLQFGRAPALGETAITDARFSSSLRGNFTTMALLPPAEASVCPPNLTNWDMPRADLITP